MKKEFISPKAKYQPIITALRKEIYRLKKKNRCLTTDLEDSKRRIETYRLMTPILSDCE